MTRSDPVIIRPVPAPRLSPDTILVVARALLPLLCWRGVAVVREKRQELTVLERFVLEMGLTLGTVEPEDFAEITSLPPSVLAGATWRLISSGIFSPRGGGYGVDPEQAAAALEQEAVRRLVRASADFVLLPRSDDLLAVTGRDGGWLRELAQRLTADQQAPLPRPLWTATRAAYLAGRIRVGAVPGLDPDVVDVPVPDQGDPPLVPQSGRPGSPGLPCCPVYLCRAEIRRADSGEHVVDAVAYGRSARKARKDQDGTAEVEIDLTGAQGLVAGWLDLASELDDPQLLQEVWREVGPPDNGYGRPPLDGARPRGPSEWELLVNGAAATELCDQDRLLAEPRGVALETAEVTIHIACHFFPADDQARALFARDEVIARLLAAQQPAKELPVACQEAALRFPGADGALREESVRERIWRLGHHHLVYMLREHKDFAYD